MGPVNRLHLMLLQYSKSIALVALISVSLLVLCLEMQTAWTHKSEVGADQPVAPATVAATTPVLPQDNHSQHSIPEILKEINAQNRQHPEAVPFFNSARANKIYAQLQYSGSQMDPFDVMTTKVKYAKELLNAGKTESALKVCQAVEQEIKVVSPRGWKIAGPDLLMSEALCELRLGELQNCCDRNNPHSCLLPISGSGIHTKQAGSRGAIRCLTEALNLEPDNLSARWLLNIACMTVGDYPQKVPARWLIPLKTFGGDAPMQKFYNAAPKIGLDLLGWAGSVIMEDFEGNGLLDLVISSWNVEGPLRYFHNNGDGTFTERTKQAGFEGEIGGLNMITTDYNNDGRPDIIVLRGGWMNKMGHYPLSLLRNDGKGHFTDVTIEAGLLTYGPTQTAVAFDYNGDGLLDLFVGYEATPQDPVHCKLFRNNGDNTFTDATEQCGLNIVQFVKGVVSADFTHSGRPGLYLSCGVGQNILLRNDGPATSDHSAQAPWKFTDVSHQAGVDLQYNSFSTFFFDYDNDGWPDIYVGGYGGVTSVGDIARDYLGLPTTAEKAKLYHNNHDGTFTDVSKQAHLDKVIHGMGINFGDLDNDGWLDFYVGTGNPDLSTLIPNRMFRNHNGKQFDEVTTTGDFGHLQKGHGIAFGDLNNNGQQDIFLVAGGAFEGDTAHDCLFVNPGNSNHWVTLALTGTKSNHIALGAEICVTVTTPQGLRKIYRTVSTGGSFGTNPLRQEIGLGDAIRIEQVTIHWPASGVDQILKHLSMNRFYKIREGDAEAQPWNVPTFRL